MCRHMGAIQCYHCLIKSTQSTDTNIDNKHGIPSAPQINQIRSASACIVERPWLMLHATIHPKNICNKIVGTAPVCRMHLCLWDIDASTAPCTARTVCCMAITAAAAVVTAARLERAQTCSIFESPASDSGLIECGATHTHTHSHCCSRQYQKQTAPLSLIQFYYWAHCVASYAGRCSLQRMHTRASTVYAPTDGFMCAEEEKEEEAWSHIPLGNYRQTAPTAAAAKKPNQTRVCAAAQSALSRFSGMRRPEVPIIIHHGR